MGIHLQGYNTATFCWNSVSPVELPPITSCLSDMPGRKESVQGRKARMNWGVIKNSNSRSIGIHFTLMRVGKIMGKLMRWERVEKD